MSVSGLWNLRGWPKACGSRCIKLLPLPLLIALAVACGTSQPAPTPEPIATSAPLAPAPAAPAPSAQNVNGSNSAAALSTLPSIADVVEDVKPWVASISVESITRGLFAFQQESGDGSGIIVRPNGYIATNAHVIDGAVEIKVHLPDGQTYDGQVVGRDVVTDLAVVKIDAENLPTASFANSNHLRVGEWVLTMGNALALRGGPTVTLGIISALGRTISTDQGAGTYYDLIQTDAAINSGNSGGPLINLDGEVVGINQTIVRGASGVGFASSAAVAVPVIDSLIEHGRVIRPRIGFSGRDVSPAIANDLNLSVTEGVIVTLMSLDGPAFKAGIRAGDVMTKIDGIPTPDVASWLSLLWTYKVGDLINVEYVHSNETLITIVELAERPS